MILFRGIIGSKLYGTNTEDSDTDIGEIHVEQKSCVFGVDNPGPLEQLKVSNEFEGIAKPLDVQRHWFKDFIKLCVKGNPNVVEWLFSPNQSSCPMWLPLITNKDVFLNKNNLCKSHIGFAIAQMERCQISHGKLGSKRKDLLEKFGFDCKGVSHSIRLMYQLRQLLEIDTIIYPLVEAPLLLEIKTGQRDLQFCKFLFEQQLEIIRNLEKPCKKIDYIQVGFLMEAVYEQIWE